MEILWSFRFNSWIVVLPTQGFWWFLVGWKEWVLINVKQLNLQMCIHIRPPKRQWLENVKFLLITLNIQQTGSHLSTLHHVIHSHCHEHPPSWCNFPVNKNGNFLRYLEVSHYHDQQKPSNKGSLGTQWWGESLDEVYQGKAVRPWRNMKKSIENQWSVLSQVKHRGSTSGTSRNGATNQSAVPALIQPQVVW